MTSTEEFELLFRYLKGNHSDDNLYARYANGVTSLHLSLAPKEQQQLLWCIQHPVWIGVVDYGLALYTPSSNLRKRFALAAAIIECQPNGVELYLNQKRIKSPVFKTFIWGIKAAMTMVLAKMLFLQKRWS